MPPRLPPPQQRLRLRSHDLVGRFLLGQPARETSSSLRSSVPNPALTPERHVRTSSMTKSPPGYEPATGSTPDYFPTPRLPPTQRDHAHARDEQPRHGATRQTREEAWQPTRPMPRKRLRPPTMLTTRHLYNSPSYSLSNMPNLNWTGLRRKRTQRGMLRNTGVTCQHATATPSSTSSSSSRLNPPCGGTQRSRSA